MNLKLILLAPAFGLDGLWRKGAKWWGLLYWRLVGRIKYYHRGLGKKIRLDWNFFKTAEQMSWPELKHPTVILHGLEDDIVPFNNSIIASEGNEAVKLVEVDDGHRMLESLEEVRVAAEYLENA